MKKLLLILLCLPLLSYAQHSDRVLEIKKMYKETKSYESKGDCEKIRWFSNPSGTMEGLGFEREVNRCIYPQGYSRITLYYYITNCGGGGWVRAEYYYEDGDYEKKGDWDFYRDGSLYFAYISDGSGTHQNSTRIYFKQLDYGDGPVIYPEIEKLLVDYGDGNVEVKDRNEIERISNSALEWLEKARVACRLW